MTDTSSWSYYHKLNDTGTPWPSNMLYTPRINPEQSVMCAHYCIDLEYRPTDTTAVPEDLIDWFFSRDVKFLNQLSHLKTTPAVYDVDTVNRKIFMEWNKETFSQVLFTPGRDLDEEVPDWKKQMKDFFISSKAHNFWKLSLYPNCFFVSKDGQLKAIDNYAVVPYEERFIKRELIEGIIGKNGAYRFDHSTDENGFIDFKKFFEITVTKHLVAKSWGNTVFSDIFNEVYKDD
jgi:hypothetical protein